MAKRALWYGEHRARPNPTSYRLERKRFEKVLVDHYGFSAFDARTVARVVLDMDLEFDAVAEHVPLPDPETIGTDWKAILAGFDGAVRSTKPTASFDNLLSERGRSYLAQTTGPTTPYGLKNAGRAATAIRVNLAAAGSATAVGWVLGPKTMAFRKSLFG